MKSAPIYGALICSAAMCNTPSYRAAYILPSFVGRPARLRTLQTLCHNYVGHSYVGHDYMRHNYIGHNYIGHVYVLDLHACELCRHYAVAVRHGHSSRSCIGGAELRHLPPVHSLRDNLANAPI